MNYGKELCEPEGIYINEIGVLMGSGSILINHISRNAKFGGPSIRTSCSIAFYEFRLDLF